MKIGFFVAIICITFFTSSQFVLADQERYRLEPLFEMNVGTEVGQFGLYFMPQPFSGNVEKKMVFYAGRPWIRIDNSGNFYFMNQWKNIVKLNSKGEVMNQIFGDDGFTRPGRIDLDKWDNLYVWFRNEANIVREMRYQVAKFDKDGNLLSWIKNPQTKEPFERGYVRKVSINGTIFVCTGEEGDYKILKFDKDGNYLDLVNFPSAAEEGADGNIYVIDKQVKKYIDYNGRLKTLRGKIAISEKKIRAESPVVSEGFDVHNNIYFDLRLGYKEIELPEFKLAVSDLSIPKMVIKYDFSHDKYDTLICESLMKKDSEYEATGILKNYQGDIYEIRIFYNKPREVTTKDYVRIYKWVKVEE